MKSYTRFRLVPKSSTLDDAERPWTAKTHSGAEKIRLLEPTAQIWMKIDPYMQRQKCRPMTLVSGNIRCADIRSGFLLAGDLKWQWGCWRRQFLAISVAIFGNLRDKARGQQYYMTDYMTLCTTPLKYAVYVMYHDVGWGRVQCWGR